MRARAYQPVRGAARLGRAALQNHRFELQDAVVDVEGVCHDDGVRDALPVVLSERASAAGVLGAVAGGVFACYTWERYRRHTG